MNRPEEFELISDYASLKNDSKGNVQLTIPNGFTTPPNSSRTIEATINLGTRNAPIRQQMRSSRYGTNWAPTRQLVVDYGVRIEAPTPINQTEYNTVIIERDSPTTVRLYIRIVNFSPYNHVITSASQTVFAEINTFLSPFQ